MKPKFLHLLSLLIICNCWLFGCNNKTTEKPTPDYASAIKELHKKYNVPLVTTQPSGRIDAGTGRDGTQKGPRFTSLEEYEAFLKQISRGPKKYSNDTPISIKETKTDKNATLPNGRVVSTSSTL